MKIAVMGAGSVGGYLGGRLAIAGNEVFLIARGAHLEAISRSGLRLITDKQDITLRPPEELRITGNPGSIGHVDLVLLTVKTYQISQAVTAMTPLAGPQTVVLCLQNGVDSYQEAAEALGEATVLPGAVYLEASITEPGVVRQSGDVVRVVFGELDGADSPRGGMIQTILQTAEIDAEFTQDIRKALWSKFIFIAAMAGATSVSRRTMAQLMPEPHWREVIISCLREIEAVGRASGVNLELGIVSQTIEYIDDSLEALSASMHADVLAGRPLELEALNGAVIRAGKDTGVPTPINEVFYALLKPYIHGGRPSQGAARGFDKPEPAI